MSHKEHHYLTCVTPPSYVCEKIDAFFCADLIRLKKHTTRKYPVYLCFCNECHSKCYQRFQCQTVESIGSACEVDVIKEIDFTFGFNFFSFYVFISYKGK